jgi:hypothetical protein
MFKKLVKYFLLLLSLFSTTKIYSEFIILDCSEINNWTDKRDVLYSLQIGTGSKKVIQVFKNNQLQMQLKETASHYEIGQYSDATETELIPLLKVNKETLVVDYSNKTKESSVVYCRRT